MPSVCAAYNCTNRSNKTVGISYFKFPLKNEELTKRWLANMRRDKWKPTAHSYICSSHFEDKYMYATNDQKRLLASAIPTLFSFPEHLQKTKTPARRSPKKRQIPESTSIEDMSSSQAGERERHTGHEDHTYSLPSPKKLKLSFEALQERHEKLKKQVKQAKQCVARKKKQIMTYQTIVTGLSRRLQDSASQVLGCDKHSDILKTLVSLQGKPSVSEYPVGVKQFALTLHFYSAHAYNYLRKFVKLPHPRTLRRWATSVNGSPGFTEESFIKLKNEVQNSSHPILATLMFDEVAIKKDLVWDGNKVWGYVDLGQGCEETDDSQVAKEALVFMVTALNKSWKIPVGYCLVNGVTANVKQNLMEQYLRKLEETGINIVAVVCDGAASNRSVIDKFGVKINSKCWFSHPSNTEKKVYCFFDAAHILKLMRNTLCEKKVLLDSDGQKIKWDYFTSLVTLQEKEGLHAANKIRKSHIHYESQKMKVALAAQTLSNSVADAIIFCRDLGLPEFVNCEGTVKFIKMVDTVFDLLNSCNVMNKGTKSPVFTGNKTTICNIIDKAIDYFMGLKLPDGNFLYLSGRKMGVCGIVLDLFSLKQLSETYLWSESPVLKYILTRRMSQDHLEQFFSSIRMSGGNRNNPNALQFKAAYRKCLIACIDPSKNANCTAGNMEPLLLPIANHGLNHSENSRPIQFDHDYVPQYEMLTLYSEKVVEYISGSIIRQVSKKVKCLGCLEVLLAPKNESKTGLIGVKDVKDSLINPSKDLVKLFKVAERVLRNHETSLGKKNFLLRMYIDVFRMLGSRPTLFTKYEHLMVSSEFGEESHYSSLIKLLLKHYFNCRMHHLCKAKSMEERGKQIRQMYTKLILFKGQ